MPTNTYTALATLTLTGTDSEIVFSSIPATYRDLILIYNGSASGNGDFYLSANGDTASNYSNVQMAGNGSSAYSSSFSSSGFYVGQLTGDRLAFKVQLMDYSATDKQKTVLTRADSQTQTMAFASRWANTAAITSLACRAISVNFATGSTFSLYAVIA